MFTLDPLKLLLVALVAVVVLGPDKLPALARRIGSLITDLERMRASLREQARHAASDLPLAEELREAQRAIGAVGLARNPQAARQALLRAAGLDVGVRGVLSESHCPGPLADGGDDTRAETAVPGSIDLSVEAPHLLRPVEPEGHGGRLGPPASVDGVWQPALFDTAAAG